MTRSYTFRLTSEGVTDLKAQMDALGPAGVASFDKIIAAAPGLGSALDNATKKAMAAHAALIDATKSDFAALQASLDPVIAAQQNFAKSRDVVTQAQKLGVATDADAAQAMALLEQRFGSANAGASAFSQGLGIGKEALAAFGVALSAERLVEYGKSLFDNAARLDDQAKQLGVSTEAAQAYQAVLRSSGVTTDEASTIIQRFTRNIGDATNASGPVRDAFNQLGISARDLAGGTEGALPKVAAALLAIPDATERARIEVELFGRSGQDLEGALDKLTDSTSTLIERQKALGQVLGVEVTGAARQTDEEWQQLKARLSNELTPAIVDATNAFLNYWEVALSGGGEAELDAKLKAQKDQLDAVAKAARDAADPTGKGAFGLNVTDTVLTTGTNPGGRPGNSQDWSTASSDKLVANMKLQADLAGLTAQRQAEEEATIELANAKLQEGSAILKDQSGNLVKQVDSYSQAREIVGQTAANQVEQYAAIKNIGSELSLQEATLNRINRAASDLVQQNQGAIEKAIATWAHQQGDAERQHAQTEVWTDDFVAQLKNEVDLAGMLPDQADRYRAQLLAIHQTHGDIGADQLAEIDQLVRMQQEAQKLGVLVQGVSDAAGDFLEKFLETGKLDFASLLADWRKAFATWLAQIAQQAILQPIIMPVVQQMAGGLSLSGSAGSAGGGAGALSQLGSLGSMGGGLGSIGSSIGGALGFGTASAAGLDAVSVTPSIFGAGGSAGVIPGSIFGTTTLGGLLGGAGVGSLAGSLLFGNKNDASLGSSGGALAGAAIGSIIPGIGTLIGGLLGGVLGGGLGSLTGSSNKAGWADLTNGGLNYAITQQGSDANTQATGQVAQSISQAIQQLQTAGVAITNDIKSVSVGSDKDYLQYTSGQKVKLSGNDPDSLINAALNHLLTTASATDSDIQKVIDTYQSQGGVNSSNLSQFMSDIGFSDSIKNIQLGQTQLTQVGQDLQQINQQFDTAVQKAQQLGLDTSQIEAARQTAIDQLVGTFETQFVDPLRALSAKPLSDFQQQMQAISQAVAAATAAAKDLGQGLDDVNEAAAAAYQAVKDNFNDGIADSIQQILDPAGAQYNELLKTQAQRVADATAAGADLNQVYQLNTLEQQQLLAAQQAAADQAAQQAAAAQAAQQAAADQASDQAKTSLASLVDDLTSGSDSGLSPDQKYFTLLTRYNQAASAATSSPNDATAIGNFQSAAQALLPAAREFLGTSQSYGVLSTSILGTATQLGGDLSDPSGIGRAIVQAQTAGSSAIVDSISNTNDKLDSLGDAFNRLSAQMQAIINRVA